MSEANGADAVEQVAQEVKDIKLENGSAPGAANGTPKEDNAIPFKVRKEGTGPILALKILLLFLCN